jgi:nucleoside-diphosphate-sugar epimerase
VRVLVTGHHGYIGSVTAPFLARAGHDVVGLDTFYYEGCDLGSSVPWSDAVRKDVRDVTPDDLVGFDAVVHLAALSNDPVGDLNPRWTSEINLEAAVKLCRAAKEAGARRFVFASSCSMYGASGTDDTLDESSPLRPLTPYAESKVRAEEAISAHASPEFSPVYMRNATAYGVSPRLRLDIVLNNLAAYAHTTGRITLHSDGSAWRPLVHVKDIAQATLALLEAPRDAVHNEAFNIGSQAQNVRIADVAQALSDRTGCEVQVSADAAADARSYSVDFSKLRDRVPSFQPEWGIEDGADELLAAYRATGLSQEDFAGPRFVRLRRLGELIGDGRLDDDLRWR